MDIGYWTGQWTLDRVADITNKQIRNSGGLGAIDHIYYNSNVKFHLT